ncbi:ABC transporter ATP-binding protein [Desulfosarcina ovata]|uniref:Nickel import ATP-binding protein NikD n=1 Tax=Desulfosarcina ovata subsp. ovata TaxID=2752305 RepID=A0A5K8AGX3_9BACT|nr:ABC transporter ATP-binding protein [Desulfosarcina ovata]BBO91818.1 nickel import ATP-binding protein NikD [Desulfosarcina ovata subsp. ovata]
MTSPAVLSVENLSLDLSTGRQKKRLVRNVSFQIREREVMGLIGESGCGKSLTCLALMGLLPAAIRQTEGRVFFNGRVLDTLEATEQRSLRGRKIAMVLQNPMSCFDNIFTIRHHFRETLVAHGAQPDRDVEAAAVKALAEVGFDDPESVLGLYPFQMSGGMLQRVMVALAVMMEVSLLIADEPTTDLDVVAQARVLDLLTRICGEHGLALLLVTHDLSVIARMADDVAVMRGGAIVESGTVTDIFHSAGHPYTQAILKAHMSLYESRLERLLMQSIKN